MLVRSDADGTGSVRVEVALDRDAAARAPDLRPRVADLRRAGWEVRGPARRPAGGVAISATKPFGSPEEAARVVAEVARGPLRDVRLTRSRSFTKTRMTFNGLLDLSRGVEGFSDPELQRQLGGRPLGVDSTRLEPIDRGLRVTVRASLPGGGATWSARPGDRVPLRLASQAWNLTNLVSAVLAVVCAIAFVVVLRRRLRTT